MGDSGGTGRGGVRFLLKIRGGGGVPQEGGRRGQFFFWFGAEIPTKIKKRGIKRFLS